MNTNRKPDVLAALALWAFLIYIVAPVAAWLAERWAGWTG